MDKRLIYTRDDGGVSQVIPTPEERAKYPELTDDEFLDHLASRVIPRGKTYRKIDKSQLPDRAFRDAWKEQDGKVVIDEAKRQAISNVSRV